MTYEEILKLVTDDFTHGKGNYSKSNSADYITITQIDRHTFKLVTTSKNTNEINAIK